MRPWRVDAVDDGGGHVAVAEHVAPSAEPGFEAEDDASPYRGCRR